MTLVERERDSAILRNQLAECRNKCGKIVVIDGPAGTGKTALLRSFAEHAAGTGAAVLHAAGTPGGGAPPMAVIRELLGAMEPPPAARAAAVRLLDQGVFTAALEEEADCGVAAGRMAVPVGRELCALLVDAAAARPVVILIDDVHHADAASLLCLPYVAQATKTAPIMLVLAERAGPVTEHAAFYAELLSHPDRHRVHLQLLSRTGQARLLAERRPTLPAATCHALTGGNPLLVSALSRSDASLEADRAGPVADTAFTQAVLAILQRSGPAVPDTARALAIVNGPASPARLGRMLDLGVEHVADALEELRTAGLLDAGVLRHPAVRAAVLDGIPAERRTALHRRAADVLHADGAPVTVVAGHLTAAAEGRPGWATTVLREAAAQAVADGEPAFALTCLRLAHRTCGARRERARIAATLADVEWRIDPGTVGRLLPELSSAARHGHLTERQRLGLAGHLLWSGRTDLAGEAIGPPAAGRAYGPSARASDTMCLLLAAVCPGRAGLCGGQDGPSSAGGASRAAVALSAIVGGHGGDDAIAAAAEVLARMPPDERSWPHLVAALGALIYADRPALAARWCDPLLEKAASLRAPTWHAILTAVRATIAVRQGDMAAAEEHAQDALSRLSPAGWGTAIGVPIAVRVLAATATGRFEEAATHLSVAVPEAMYDTVCGLHYLHARGRYHLTIGRPLAALTDFRVCGDLMTRWGCDVPGIVPWRIEAAHARLVLGEPDEAVRLADEQLTLLGPRPSTARGACLRVRALAGEPCRRAARLDAAVQVLRRGEDRYELALALADLSRARHAAGEHDAAHETADEARWTGRRHGPHPVRVPFPGEPADGATAVVPDPDAGLTEAESKVLKLVAAGHTNREIAATLLLTVSTVEQHLTKVYRKLKIGHRSELSAYHRHPSLCRIS